MSLYPYQPILLSVFPDTELRRATIPIFFDMIQCEYANKGNFTSVSIYYWSRLVLQFPYRITLCWISVLSHVEKNTVNPRAVTLLLAKCEQVQWNPVGTVTNGPKTIGRINEGFFCFFCCFFFLQENVWRFLPSSQKSGRKNEVTVLSSRP